MASTRELVVPLDEGYSSSGGLSSASAGDYPMSSSSRRSWPRSAGGEYEELLVCRLCKVSCVV